MVPPLQFPGFISCDFYLRNVVIGADGKWYTVPRADLESALLSAPPDPQQAVRSLLANGSFSVSNTRPYSEGPSPEFSVPLPEGNAYGLGPVTGDEGERTVTCFLKANGQGSAFGKPVGIVRGQQCNAEMELVALVQDERVYAWTFGCDVGIKGAFDDRRKGYPLAAGLAHRIHIGNQLPPNLELRLEIQDDKGGVLFADTRNLGDYLQARDPKVLIPLFVKGRELGKSKGVGIFLGAACNTAKGENVFSLAPGMKIAGFAGGVLVLSHPIEEVSL